MDIKQLEILQSYPLEMKVKLTEQRIKEFVYRCGGVESCYIAFSGGKDSTVLVDIARKIFPDITIVFSNTGLEFPEVVDHVKKFDNVVIVRPKKSFKQVIEQEGYPIISKQVANTVYYARKNIAKGKETLRVRQIMGKEKGSKFNKGKWKFLLNAPFKISHKCCDHLKKEPLKTYEKETGKKPIVGTMANESRQRKMSYLQTGCNTFTEGKEMCRPLGFWTEQDILQYCLEYCVEIPSVYGDIKIRLIDDETEKEGYRIEYYTTGENRTGCIFCGFGLHLEEGENRFQRLEKSHPQLHTYCMDKLGFKEVCEYINVEYRAKESK